MNDIKTLYDACSDKDELAQIAKKLGIKDNVNLSTILNEIIDAIPEGGGAEPFIVEGCHLNAEDDVAYIKAPASSESTAITAFKAGRVVLFHIIFDEMMSEDINDYATATRFVGQTLDTSYGNIQFNL